MVVCVLLLVNRNDVPATNGGISPDDDITYGVIAPDEVGGDWRTWRGYSIEGYIITDELSILPCRK